MSQPNFKCVANLGDANPIEYGGYFVLVDETGVYPAECVVLDTYNDAYADPHYDIYRFIMDKCTYIDGILSDNKFHPELPAWFANPIAHLDNVAKYISSTLEELIKLLCSDNPIERAMAYKALGDYHCFINFDTDPLKYKYDEKQQVIDWVKHNIKY